MRTRQLLTGVVMATALFITGCSSNSTAKTTTTIHTDKVWCSDSLDLNNFVRQAARDNTLLELPEFRKALQTTINKVNHEPPTSMEQSSRTLTKFMQAVLDKTPLTPGSGQAADQSSQQITAFCAKLGVK